MTGRAFAFASSLFTVALGAYGVASCNSTATVVAFSGSQGTPSVSIISPIEGECIAAPSAGPLTVPVAIDVTTFYLRPPGSACADTYNCGYVQLYVDKVLTNASGSAQVDATLTPGTHTLTVELVVDVNDGGGSDIFDAGVDPDASTVTDAGTPPPTGQYTASVTVTVAASCADGGDAGDAGDGG